MLGPAGVNSWLVVLLLLHSGVHIVQATTQCAKENDECCCNGKVSFGKTGQGWTAWRDLSGSIGCNRAAFGLDPAPNEEKTCLCNRGHALSQTLEDRRLLANTLVQNRHYAGGVHRNLLRLMQCHIHEYAAYEQQVRKLYRTAARGPVPRQMSRWKTKTLQGMHQRSPWFDGYAEIKERFFHSATVHATATYTTRCSGALHHYIRHTLQVCWDHKQDFYEHAAGQMNVPQGRKRGRPDDWKAQWAIKRQRAGGR